MYYLFIMRQVICWFTAFLDSNLHTRLAIVTENELGLAFPPRNLPKKFHPDPSTFYLVIVVTNKQADRQTNRQTNAGDYIIPRESFAGIIIYQSTDFSSVNADANGVHRKFFGAGLRHKPGH